MLRVLLPCLAFVLAACQQSTPPMTPQETIYMDALTQTLTPRCVGRFLIDLPSSMAPVPGSGIEVEDVTISIVPISQPRFELALENRKTELRDELMPPNNYPWLHKTYALPGTDEGIVFDRAKSSAGSDRFSRTIELWAWRDGYQIHAEVSARDTSFPEDQGDQYVAKQKTTTPEKLAHLLEVYSRTRGRADTNIPTEPGICFAHGFVAGKAGKKEKMGILYVLKNVPDVSLGFEYDALFQEDTSLLDRGKEINAMLKSSNGRSLRKGKNKTGGVSAEEWLMTGNTDSDVMGHMFTLESSNKTGNETTPFFVIDMKNGNFWEDDNLDNPRPKLTKATLSDAQAIAFWDRVTSTLRLRSNAF